MAWWYTQHEEHLHGYAPTREECIAKGTAYYCGEPFMICEGTHFKNQVPDFDSWFAEAFDDANADYACEDEGPATSWSDDHYKALIAKLEAVANEWLDEHGYRNAYAIDTGPYEQIDPALLAERSKSGEEARG